MTEFKLFSYQSMLDRNAPIANYKDAVNTQLERWLRQNPGFEPYGNPIIENNIMYQTFVKYSSQLNDKFLSKFLDELQYLPGIGSAYNAAYEQWQQSHSEQTPPEPPVKSPGAKLPSVKLPGTGGKKIKKNKTRKNKARKNK